ncbi:TPA: LPXTG cell wall anchor domain-containing protein, partial [Streptococcus suis]|nr:LPXTG cell wall anchor domain-containing protein [Streptococcus suis]HEM6386098.1 LPXTG cell wall anchor domain-containing protein [Streptococcus suis]
GYEFVKMEDGSAPEKGEVKEADQHVVYVYRKAKVNNDKPVIPYNNNNGGKIAGSLPKTGDSSDILLYSGTSIISLVALAIIAYKKRAASR